MNNKISDFKIAESVLRVICKNNGVSFVDIPITFEEVNTYPIDSLYIGETKNVAHTIYKIVSEYIVNSQSIFGKQLFQDEEKRRNFLIKFASYLKSLIYDKIKFTNYLQDLTIQYLYQKPLVWLLMKDLVCPTSYVSLKNIKLIAGSTPYIDIAKFYEEGEIKKGDTLSYPFIFVNQIDCFVVQ
ncbi:MAG TPA: hypothetical protein VMZ91_12905, partial [Candidatus Paceibacterota bacterium]|nr:hypothetical protein [Candidatus Paceibacterota bacterium]